MAELEHHMDSIPEACDDPARNVPRRPPEAPPVGAIAEVHGPVVDIACEVLPPLHRALYAYTDLHTVEPVCPELVAQNTQGPWP